MATRIVVDEKEFDRAFNETLLEIEKALRDPSRPSADDPFRTVNYHVRVLQSRLKEG